MLHQSNALVIGEFIDSDESKRRSIKKIKNFALCFQSSTLYKTR